jgi:hypothetical protein
MGGLGNLLKRVVQPGRQPSVQRRLGELGDADTSSQHSVSSRSSAQPIFDLSVHGGDTASQCSTTVSRQAAPAVAAAVDDDTSVSSRRRREAAARRAASNSGAVASCSQQLASLFAPTTLFEAQLADDSQLALHHASRTVSGTLARLAQLALLLAQQGGHRVVRPQRCSQRRAARPGRRRLPPPRGRLSLPPRPWQLFACMPCTHALIAGGRGVWRGRPWPESALTRRAAGPSCCRC